MSISEQQFRDLLDRYLDNTCTQAERDLLDRFFDSYQGDLSDPELLEHNPQLQREIFNKLKKRLGTSAARPDGYSLTGIWLRAAAVISFFVLAYFFIDRNTGSTQIPDSGSMLVEERSPRGQKLVTKLPDGSNVYLNSESKISFPKTFGNDTREVTVVGEAYFEVVKDEKPFIVHAGHIQTEVLGTSFNVKNIAGKNIEVTLVEGRVNIVDQMGKSSVLQPNQQAVVSLNSNEMIIREVNTLSYVGWKDNILLFENTTLKEAIGAVELWYNVRIDINNPVLEGCVISAKYQDEPLDNVLSSFQFLLNLEIIRRDKNHIIINGNGCK